ncbi:hypothetical protein LSH36_3g16006 [Paralvinella palmiformis]|uniref:Uncharacterized protein n=1 Tax=Paralvinella palmiformis TaxID=53620 RepID=A0AAD9KFP2_9ANNE|nr:hypothetical protein LSH36_3g16006 [Paralvinella palmiformis]
MDNMAADDRMEVMRSDRSMSDYLVFFSITAATLISLCVIKYSQYSFLRRRRDNEIVSISEMTISTTLSHLPWYYSDLCCELIIFLTMASTGFYSLHFTTLLLKPFTGKEAFHSCEIFLCVALGCLSYRLIRLLLGSDMKPRFKLLQAYVVVAMVGVFSFVLVLFAVIHVCHLSTVIASIRQIYGTLMESENSHLLQRQNDRQHYGMQPATSALIKGTNKVEIV